MDDPNIAFTNWSHHYISKFIPLDEIWIDQDAAADPEETEFLIEAAITHYRLMRGGMGYDQALAISNRKEQAMRQKYDGTPIPANDPEPDLSQILIQPIGTCAGLEFWLVNEKRAQDLCYVNFVEGGNPAVYAFVPAGQGWIGDQVAPEERDFIKLHEADEYSWMHRAGMSYTEAHREASHVEWVARQHPETLPDLLAKEDSAETEIAQ